MKDDAGRWERPCEICLGEKCDSCANEGWIQEQGSPPSHLTSDGRDLFHAYRMLKDYGVFPVPGGWLQQTHKFLRAVSICDQVHGMYSRRAMAKSEQIKHLQEEVRKVMGRVSDGR